MRHIKFTSNINGILNREVGTTFNFIAPASHYTNLRAGEEFNIIYQTSGVQINVGVAFIEVWKIFSSNLFSDLLTLTAWGYPAGSVKTAFKKMYPEFKIGSSDIVHIVFRWEKKFVKGFEKIHFKSAYLQK